MKDIYLTQNGTLERKDNTLIFSNENTKKIIPINDVDGIYAISEISLNSKLLQILAKNHIPVYFFNYYGFYCGVFAPRQENVSGKLLIEQVKCYTNHKERTEMGKEFLRGALHNIRKTLMQYSLSEESKKMQEKLEKIDRINKVQCLLLLEAEARQLYYRQFNKIIKDKDFEFVKRTRQPPDNFINTLISFGNSLFYTTVLSEIFKTQLDPRISYLHEPFERRYSLNLDLSDIFKPLIVDRVIFTLINKNIIKPEHFDKELNYCYLNNDGRKLFIREYDTKLKSTIKYPKLNRNVSYKYMIRLECYKIIKHLLEGEKYKSFKIYW
ncbi:MAG: type I-B CRISPR-associated endonuclease Cas1b [Nanoarchaeota archaeon]